MTRVANGHAESRAVNRAIGQPTSELPRVIEAWEEPAHAEFLPRSAWSLLNTVTEIAKTSPARAQVDGSLRFSSLHRVETNFN